MNATNKSNELNKQIKQRQKIKKLDIIATKTTSKQTM